MHGTSIVILLAASALANPTPLPEEAKLTLTFAAPAEGETAAGTGLVAVEGKGKDGATEHHDVKATIPGTVSFRLRSGLVWRVTLRSPQYWAAAKSVFLATDDEALIPIVPLGTLRLHLDEARKDPPAMTVSAWTAAVGRGAPSAPLLSDEPCTVDKTVVECRAPSGSFDLRLVSRGFMPTYYWGKVIPPHGTLDLGGLRLAEGSSVSGWCEGLGSGQTALVMLTPVRLGGQADPRGSQQSDRRALSGKVSERGFFQITGVPVGEYALTVQAEGLLAGELRVRVMPGVEARLPESIRLTPPSSLAVSITPLADPRGQPWRAEVIGLSRERGRKPTGAQGVASSDGLWTAAGLRPGSYILNVTDAGGNVWESRLLSVEGASSESVVLAQVEVEGILTRKAQALAADLVFENLPMTVSTQANAEGRFACTLPREGRWDVRVDGASEHATVADVEVRVPPGKARAWVEIDLAATRLRGIVVDREGKPQANFLILAHGIGSGKSSDARSLDDGTFEINALPAGEYQVKARAPLESQPVMVSLKEDEESTVRLTVDDGRHIKGIVTSPWGSVAGAGIIGLPHGARQVGVPISILAASTDADGSFEVTLPVGADAADLLIVPPGLAGRLVLLTASDETVRIAASADGGVLRIVRRGPGSLDLTNGSASIPLRTAAQLLGSRLDAGGQAVSSFVMEPGRYGICREPQGPCTWGELPPGGELTLESPQVPPRTSQ